MSRPIDEFLVSNRRLNSKISTFARLSGTLMPHLTEPTGAKPAKGVNSSLPPDHERPFGRKLVLGRPSATPPLTCYFKIGGPPI